MRRPTVSVIIPTYNRTDSLSRAIRSVLSQTYQDLEIVVVDDASEADVRALISGFHETRIRYVRHSRNKGVAAAKNSGIRVASGQYIAFLDDDDVYAARKIERQLEVFDQSPPHVGLVYCAASYVTGDGHFLGRKKPEKRGRDISYHIDNIGPTSLVRSSCFERVGLFDESFRCFEDWDMWLRIADKCDIESCSESLYVDIYHSSPQLSRDLELMLGYLRRVFEKHASRIDSLPERSKKRMFSKYHKTKAVSFYDSKMIREGRKEAAQAFFLDPLDGKIWKLVIAGFLGARFWRSSGTLRLRSREPTA